MPRAVRFDNYGDVDVLYIADVPRPEPGPEQLLVRVRATAINPGEAKIREGLLHDRWPATFPSGEGSDLAGIVEEVGSEVTTFAVGDEVIGYTDNRSSHAEYAVVAVADATPKPPAVSWEAAGSLFVAGTTAWAMVHAVGLGSGDTVVVAGATGGVGVFAVQLAVARGARVIGIASARGHEWLQAHGVIPVAYSGDVAAAIQDAAGAAGVDALLDSYGPPYVELGLSLGVAPDRIDTIADFAAVEKFGVKADGNGAGGGAATLAKLAALIAEGKLEVPIANTFPLEQVQDAYAELESGHPLGKIVLIP